MSTTAPTIAPETVTIRPTTLLEVGIAELESDRYQRCTLVLRHCVTQDMRCAEGVFAEQLVAAYPERYAWLSDGQLLDRETGRNGASLYRKDWNVLHPRGYDLACAAANSLRSTSIAQANDFGVSFAAMAKAFRGALAELAAGTLPDYEYVTRH